MQTENGTTVRSNERAQARRELLRWICRNETRRRPISSLEDTVIVPIASVALDTSDPLDVLDTLDILVALVASDDSIESVESVELDASNSRIVYPQAADPSLLTV